MSKPSFYIGAAIACTSVLTTSAIALPLPPLQPEPTSRLDANAPLCYIQFQGSSAIDVSKVCGKRPDEAPRNATVVEVSSATPPVFDPTVMNASTTGQCNFVDANGKPCPQKQPQ